MIIPHAVKTKKMIVLQARQIAIECNVGITLTTNIFKHMKDHYKEDPLMTKISEKIMFGARLCFWNTSEKLREKKIHKKYKWNLIKMNQRKKKINEILIKIIWIESQEVFIIM